MDVGAPHCHNCASSRLKLPRACRFLLRMRSFVVFQPSWQRQAALPAPGGLQGVFQKLTGQRREPSAVEGGADARLPPGGKLEKTQ